MSDFSTFSVCDVGSGRPKKPKIGTHVVLCLMTVLVTAAVFVLYQQYRAHPGSVAVSPPIETSKDPAARHARIWRPRSPAVRPAVTDNSQTSASPPQGIDSKFMEDASPKDTEPTEDPIDPARQKAFTKAVANVRGAMAKHNLPSARSRLDRATANAQTEDESALVDRLDTMLGYLEEFWVGAQKAIDGLESGSEFSAGGTVVVVVEVNENDVVVRAVGENRRYPIDDLPHKMLLALAEKCFADVPSSKALIGAYLAVDPKGDPARARQLWQEASGQGIDIDQVMPELDHWASVPRSARSLDELRDRPADEELLKDTRRKVVEQFKEDYERAASLPRKVELARKLLAAADKGGDPITYLAMIHEAKALAIASGEVSIVCQTIDELAQYSTLDVLAEKATSLEEASAKVRGLTASRELVNRALKLMDEAIALERADEAKTLADLAAKVAQRSKNVSLIKRAAVADERLGGLDKAE